MNTDLKQLLLETHQGHEPSARALWHTQAPRLLRYARAIVVSWSDAEDVVQVVFCRVLNMARREVERVSDPGAWLAQVTRREAINHLRSRKREAARREAAGGLGLHRDDNDPAPIDADLEAAIERLPRRFREVIVLKHVAGLTFDQIAAATGLNRNTAASRYKSSVEALRDLLEPRSMPSSRARPAVQEVVHG